MHAKSDSDVTSLPGSSPPRSPPRQHPHAASSQRSHQMLVRPAYYVQSPSRDSHDGGDSKLSFQSTPLLSPLGSPLHPATGGAPPSSTASGSFARARDSASETGRSSASYSVSGSKHHRLPNASRRVQPQPSGHHQASETLAHDKKRPFTIFEEDEFGTKATSISASQIYTFLLVVVSCAVFLALFILFFWLICKPGRPAVSVKSVVFHNLYVGQGADASGVPTMLISMNSTVYVDYLNPSKYFGAHLEPLAVEFDYSELAVASKEMNGYVQGKNSRKTIAVGVRAVKVPLYGANTDPSTAQKASISLAMTASVCSHYYIMGKMIKSVFCSQVACDLAVNSNTMALLNPLKTACTYTPPL